MRKGEKRHEDVLRSKEAYAMSPQGKQTQSPANDQKSARGSLPAANGQMLQASQRRGMLAVLGGMIAFFALLGDLPPAQGSWLAAFSVPINLLFGWGAVLVCMGGLVLAGDLIIAAVRGHAMLRPGHVWGAVVAMVVLLSESHLLLGARVGGLFGYIGAAALQPLPMFSRQILVFGILGIDGLLTFQISWREVRLLAMALARRPQPLIPPRPGGIPASTLFATPPPQVVAKSQPEPAKARRAPRAPQTAGGQDATLATDGAVEALRVPAYLRRGTGPDAAADFALPPLTPRATVTANASAGLAPSAFRGGAATAAPAFQRAAGMYDDGWRLPMLDMFTTHAQRFHSSPVPYDPMVTFGEVVASAEFRDLAAITRLTLALGRNGANRILVADLGRFPHVLIAGATGAGTPLFLNDIIAALLLQATPEQLKLVLIDPGMLAFTPYANLPHLLMDVVTQPRRAAPALESILEEMDRRLQLFARLGVRDIESYAAQSGNASGGQTERLPRMVVVIGELADLMAAAADSVERLICRLARLARTTGIHLIVATQRPSEVVITGPIKATIPTRIAFKVASLQDSRAILDSGGAEQLRGHGDMLYLASDAASPERIQCAQITDEEIGRLVAFWVAQKSGRLQPRR